ncbi:Magnesium transporter MgtE [Symbiodinium microadriaticum]|uniref:Magnesium transporter MgtE n=1 Tax=Symbiodinium microadriaticum TaxID=2951 RepID=A0A1Q9C2W9_SYMMI|nr:Magnesium transporter MgtE [Symbiodinium microadriaticum]
MDAVEEELGLLVDYNASESDGGQGGPMPDGDEASEVRHRRNRREASNGDSASRPPASHDEDGSSATLQIFWHRAGWLVLLLFCQSSSSFILQRFEFLIKSHPTVIYFLTMLVGAGGNAGGQSTVLVVRRLALASARWKARGVEPAVSVRRIVGPEILVGAKLSLVLFGAAFLRCAIFKVYGAECIAICLSMLVIVFCSTALGAALPIVLNKLGLDPAHAGATIQVLMDVSGVALTCVISSMVLGFNERSSPAPAPAASGPPEILRKETSLPLAPSPAPMP